MTAALILKPSPDLTRSIRRPESEASSSLSWKQEPPRARSRTQPFRVGARASGCERFLLVVSAARRVRWTARKAGCRSARLLGLSEDCGDEIEKGMVVEGSSGTV